MPLTGRPGYLTDDDEVGHLAHLLARFMQCTSPEQRTYPTTPLELAVIAAAAAQHPAVQHAAARLDQAPR
ncbi:MAG TPA: hypothetical protein VIY28_14965 [Pseudonocardiaceae bacterium]